MSRSAASTIWVSPITRAAGSGGGPGVGGGPAGKGGGAKGGGAGGGGGGGGARPWLAPPLGEGKPPGREVLLGQALGRGRGDVADGGGRGQLDARGEGGRGR